MTFGEWWQENGHKINGAISTAAACRVAWEASKSKWRPIDTAPEDEPVLVVDVCQFVVKAERYGDQWYICDNPEDSACTPEKWMPLPEPD